MLGERQRCQWSCWSYPACQALKWSHTDTGTRARARTSECQALSGTHTHTCMHMQRTNTHLRAGLGVVTLAEIVLELMNYQCAAED
jgi:hypothetical protein